MLFRKISSTMAGRTMGSFTRRMIFQMEAWSRMAASTTSRGTDRSAV